MTDIYDVGTVSVTNGSTRVTSEGAALWIPENIKSGDVFKTNAIAPALIASGPVFDADNDNYYIDLSLPYDGTTATGVAYSILKTSSEWGTNRTLAGETAALIQAFSANVLSEADLNAAVADAESARDDAVAAADTVGDKILSPKTSDPTLDDDGNTLTDGTMYLNTVSNLMRVRIAGAWTNLTAGTQGIQGDGAGLRYTFSTTTTDSDPGSGIFRFDNTDPTLVTKLRVDNVDANGNTQTATLDTWDDSTSTIKGTLYVWNRTNRAMFRVYTVTGSITDKSGYREATLTYVASSGTIANAVGCELVFVPKGDKGDTGAAGQTAGVPFTFSTTTTDGDPGNGLLRADNATFGSITFLYADNQDSSGNATTGWLDSLDDVTNANARGYIRLQKATDPSVFMELAVVGPVTDGTGYRKVPVSPISGAVPADATALVATFAPAGADGSEGSDGGDPGVLLNFDTSTTDSNPSAGGIRADNATLTSATKLYVSKTNRAGHSIATFLATLDDSTNPTVKGNIVLTRPSDGAQIVATLTVLTDASGYVKLTLGTVSGAAGFSNNDPVSFQFTRAGDQGSSGAGTGDVNKPASTAVLHNIVGFANVDGDQLEDTGLDPTDVMLGSNNLSDVATAITAKDNLSTQGADIASASTVNLETATGHFVDVTGTTTTTAITLNDGHERWVRAAGAWPITVGASLVLNNGGSSYTCAAGDWIHFIADGSVIRGTIFPIAGTPLQTVPITKGGTGATSAGAALVALMTKGSDIASASTTNIGAATGWFIHVTGTTTITAFDSVTAGIARIVEFTGALTLTHNGTSLILPGAANITTAAGDCAIFVSEGSGNWRCVSYSPAARAASATNSGIVELATTAETITGSDTVRAVTPAGLAGWMANGQLKFPASQNASADANTLDDYEEGTWTPAFSATSATFSHATQEGYYTKIGNLVVLTFRLSLNTSGNTLNANNLSITGLPFAASGVSNVTCPLQWASSTTAYVQMSGFLASGASAITVRGLTAAATTNIGSIAANAALHATAGSSIWGTISYFV